MKVLDMYLMYLECRKYFLEVIAIRHIIIQKSNSFNEISLYRISYTSFLSPVSSPHTTLNPLFYPLQSEQNIPFWVFSMVRSYFCVQIYYDHSYLSPTSESSFNSHLHCSLPAICYPNISAFLVVLCPSGFSINLCNEL